jgi:hypothetical protein
LAKRAVNQEVLRWARVGAAQRLAQLTAETASIYRAFPELRRLRSRRDEPQTTATRRTRRRMSAAGRAKLRAAAKRRWAEAKKAGKKRLG